jgi:hypothetical protein
MLPPPEFLKIFTDRQQCFAELLELSQKQLGLVEADEYTQLLGLLGGKQKIITRLDMIGKARPQLWDEWRLERDRLAPRIRQACEQALAETEALLSQLLESERVGTERLTRRRDETARALRTIASGSRVNQAYRDSLAPVTHRHLDLDQ